MYKLFSYLKVTVENYLIHEIRKYVKINIKIIIRKDNTKIVRNTKKIRNLLTCFIWKKSLK